MLDQHLVAYYIGIAVILLANIYFLINEKPLLEGAWLGYAHLVAVACIAYYFMHKEGFIKF